MLNSDTNVFDQEVHILRRLVHSHIIPLLATYEYRDHFHTIIPWAECNLAEYWEQKNPNPSQDLATLKWTAEQCEGIAMGLASLQHHATTSASSLMVMLAESSRSPEKHSFLSRAQSIVSKSTSPKSHHFFGRHGDIKPLNLLWFPNSGKGSMGAIKISDFGEGEFSTTKSYQTSSNEVAYTPSYRPPECDYPNPEMITATYDTWTLGCLFLEFATWYVGGQELLRKFEQSRSLHDPHGEATTFFELTGEEQGPHARVKLAVQEVGHRSL